MNKNMKILLIIGVIVVLAVVAYVATKDNTVNTPAGDIEVSGDGDTVQVNTNAGSLQAGEDVSLPDDFPTDVYVIDGDLKASLQLAEGNGYSVSIESTQTVASVKVEYTTNLESDGWTIESSLDLGIGSSILAKKGERTVSVSIASVDDKTQVTLTVMDVDEE